MATANKKNLPGFKVLTGAFTMPLDAEAKKVQRYLKGDTVYPDPEYIDVDHLVAIKAIGSEDDEAPTAPELAKASRVADGQPDPSPGDSGKPSPGNSPE